VSKQPTGIDASEPATKSEMRAVESRLGRFEVHVDKRVGEVEESVEKLKDTFEKGMTRVETVLKEELGKATGIGQQQVDATRELATAIKETIKPLTDAVVNKDYVPVEVFNKVVNSILKWAGVIIATVLAITFGYKGALAMINYLFS
jgi:uncharacterized protein YjbJ (UPF0337 family)